MSAAPCPCAFPLVTGSLRANNPQGKLPECQKGQRGFLFLVAVVGFYLGAPGHLYHITLSWHRYTPTWLTLLTSRMGVVKRLPSSHHLSIHLQKNQHFLMTSKRK